jgi:hypothetical protein
LSGGVCRECGEHEPDAKNIDRDLSKWTLRGWGCLMLDGGD